MKQAEEMWRAGTLEVLYLFPLEFGGQRVPQNMLFVPLGIAAIKERIDSMIQDLVNQGQVTAYTAVPEYKGDSVIPSKIKMTATHPEKKGGVNPVIDIW